MAVKRISLQGLLALGETSEEANSEIAESVRGLVGGATTSRNDYLRDEGLVETCEHVGLLFEQESGEVAGYGYGWYEPGERWMEVFAAFVQNPYRRQGIAMSLFREMISIGLSAGVTRFNVLFAEPNEARSALREAILRFQHVLPAQASMTVWYGGQVTKIQGSSREACI